MKGFTTKLQRAKGLAKSMVELHQVAKARGYKSGWVYHQGQIYGIYKIKGGNIPPPLFFSFDEFYNFQVDHDKASESGIIQKVNMRL